ncbi:MAG: glutaredoxin family protein [Gammaproteobacteria bacterium]
MFIRVARKAIGAMILGVDKITSPSSLQRTDEQQAHVDQKTSGITLFEMLACPFCVKVRREIKRLGLNIERVDVKRSDEDMNTLVNQGGKFQVPCLRIEHEQDVEWLYESDDIINYLRNI